MKVRDAAEHPKVPGQPTPNQPASNSNSARVRNLVPSKENSFKQQKITVNKKKGLGCPQHMGASISVCSQPGSSGVALCGAVA